MQMSRAATVVFFLFAAACGDNQSVLDPDAGMPPVDSGLDEDGCRILTVGERDFQFNLIDQLLGLRFPVTPNLDASRTDVLHVELWDSTTPGLPPLVPGTFDLATQSDLATCQHCVWVDVDATDDGSVDDIYVATEGSLTIETVTDPLEPVFAGHSGRIVLRRATVGDGTVTTLVPGGDCVSISAVAFDTTPTPGHSCESAEDCGNPLFEICDPSTNTCGDPECNFDQPCEGNNEICLIQYRDLFSGACYTVCDPRESAGCASGQQCEQRGPDPSFGICKYLGDGAAGSDCTPEDNTTACVAGTVCSGESHTCAATCSFFADDPGCPGTSECSLFWLCEPPDTGVDVPVGQPCGDDATMAQGCAPDGDAFRGICFAFEGTGDPLVCETACLGDQGCASGEFCALRFSSGVGICLPNPVCGDGVKGEINEVCDDGDTMDGDGCSADCQTVDESYLCSHATTLAVGTSDAGDTSTGVDGLMNSCQAGTARAELYEVTAPARGRLRIHVTSDTAQSVSLRTTCTDPATETTCVGDFGVATDQELIIQETSATPAPITVLVSSMTVLEEGPYTIETDFVAEQCNDSIIAGREVCDDGNTTSNDGCSGDCRTIEYNYYCTQAPVLSTSATNAGDLTGAPLLYAASCDATTEPSESRLFTFTAPAAGTLDLHLTDGTSFAVLSVIDGCGSPATTPELVCRPAFLDGQLSLPLASGQSITAVVTSYFAGQNLGAFTLDATFTPQ